MLVCGVNSINIGVAGLGDPIVLVYFVYFVCLTWRVSFTVFNHPHTTVLLLYLHLMPTFLINPSRSSQRHVFQTSVLRCAWSIYLGTSKYSILKEQIAGVTIVEKASLKQY